MAEIILIVKVLLRGVNLCPTYGELCAGYFCEIIMQRFTNRQINRIGSYRRGIWQRYYLAPHVCLA